MDDQRVLSSRVTSKFMNLHSAKSNERTSTSDTEPSVLAFAMVDLSGLRSNPRPSAKGAALQGADPLVAVIGMSPITKHNSLISRGQLREGPAAYPRRGARKGLNGSVSP